MQSSKILAVITFKMNFQNQRQFRKQELMSKLMAKLRQLKKITMSLDDLVQPGALDSSDEMNRQYSQLSLGSSSSEAQESIESSDRGIEVSFILYYKTITS